MLEIVDYKNIKKGIRYIPWDINTNSKIYKEGLNLNKFPKKKILVRGNLEEILKYIDKNKISCCVKIKRMIYKDNRFVAYTITFYKDYKSLRRLLKKDFALKKQDCINIEKTFNELSENNLQFCDAVLSNVLINNNGDVLICDLDGLKITNKKELKKFNRINLFILVLAYLYKIPTNEISALLRNKEDFLIRNNDKLEKIFYRLYHEEIVDVKALLDIITEKDVKKRRKQLKSEIKSLKNNPYYKKYFGY